MVNVVVTEIPPKLEPVREDSFVSVAISDHASESRLHRIADLFGSERGRLAIVDYAVTRDDRTDGGFQPPRYHRIVPAPAYRTGCGKPALAVRASADADRHAVGQPSRQHADRHTAAVDLYWIPLGAGGHYVRFNGRVFEALEAARRHRERCDLYHAALVLELDGDRYTIELAPSPNADESSRGVVATGAVGSRYAARLRLFRYEVRCWRNGSIPDLGEAVGGPRRLSSDPRVALRLLDLVRTVPTPVWGRDELKAGEMWNSNSVAAWLIAAAGLPTDLLRPPPHGRAPGWHAGLEVARRSSAAEHARAAAWPATADRAAA